MTTAYGNGYPLNSGFHGYNQVYTLDTTRDNMLADNPQAVPGAVQKRPSAYPVGSPTPPTPVVAVSADNGFPSLTDAKLFYVSVAILIMVLLIKILRG